MHFVGIIIFSLCVIVNVLQYIVGFTDSDGRIFQRAWPVVSSVLLVAVFLYSRQYVEGHQSFWLYLAFGFGWFLIALIGSVVGEGLASESNEIKSVVRAPAQPASSPKRVNRTPEPKAAKVSASEVDELPPIRRRPPSGYSVNFPELRTRVLRERSSGWSISDLAGYSPSSSDANWTDEAVSDQVETIDDSFQTRPPKMKYNPDSLIRARGMQRLYQNWRYCYFELGRPFGQTIETEVLLVCEPQNRYDPNAVVVCLGNVKLGYVPAELAPGVSALLRQSGGIARADGELWFDYRRGLKRNSVRLLIQKPFGFQ